MTLKQRVDYLLRTDKNATIHDVYNEVKIEEIERGYIKGFSDFEEKQIKAKQLAAKLLTSEDD